MSSKSGACSGTVLDLSNDQPLRIGFGATDYFHGKIRDVRVHRRALGPGGMEPMAAQGPGDNG